MLNLAQALCIYRLGYCVLISERAAAAAAARRRCAAREQSTEHGIAGTRYIIMRAYVLYEMLTPCFTCAAVLKALIVYTMAYLYRMERKYV